MPRFSSAFSALGCLTAALSYAEQHALRMSSTGWDAAAVAGLRDRMWQRLAAPILAAGRGPEELSIEQLALIHYAGQSDTVEVPFEPPADPQRLGEAFRARHHALYGFTTDEPWELEALRVTVSARQRPERHRVDGPNGPGEPSASGTASCWFDDKGPLACRRHARDRLAVGVRIVGPAIVEDAWSTVVVDPQSSLWADARGHLHLEVAGLP